MITPQLTKRIDTALDIICEHQSLINDYELTEQYELAQAKLNNLNDIINLESAQIAIQYQLPVYEIKKQLETVSTELRNYFKT
jgi:hypothetical protein